MNISPLIMIEATAGGGGGGGATYIDETVATGFGTITGTLPTGVTASDTLIAIAWSDISDVSAMAAPSGWTAGTGVANPAEGRGARYFTALGNVGTLEFTGTNLTDLIIVGVTAPLRAAAIEAVDYSGSTGGAGSGANQPTPAVTAVADDCVISIYIQYDDGAVGPMTDPGTPQAGYTRQLFSNSAAPYLSVLSDEGVASGSTGTITHDTEGAFSGRFLFTGTFGV